MSQLHHCPNCSAVLQGPWCHACGQKRIHPEERRFRWFLGQFLKAITTADSRLMGSLGRLVFRPGALERDWLAGRRRRHLAPLSLFLLANLVYFFHPPLTDLNLSLADQVHLQPYSALAERLVTARLETRQIEFASYAVAYQAEATAVAKLLVIIHAPLLAVVLMLVHWRQRWYLVDHLAVSLNYWAFVLFAVMVVPMLLAGLHWLTGLGSQATMQLGLTGLLCVYAWQQLRVAYGQPGWLALARLPIFFTGFVAAHFCYRAAQFLIAFALS